MNLYQEHILDHYHNPRNATPLAVPTHTSHGHNTSCGDTLSIELLIESDIIKDAAFRGEGCAISQAAASILTEHIKGQSVNTLKSMDVSAMIELLGIPLSPARIKCGLLALETAHDALKSSKTSL